jgi:predicted Zn-dependent protease
MTSRSQAQKIVREAVRGGRSFSSRAAVEVLLSASDESLTRFAENAIHQNVASRGAEVVVRVLLGRKVGRASSTRTDAASVRATARRAAEIASCQRPDPEQLPLPGPARYTPVCTRAAATARCTPAMRAAAVARAAAACRRRGLKASGTFSTTLATVAVGNSRGVFAMQEATEATFGLTATGSDSSGWAETSHRDIRALDVEKTIRTAVEKALASRRPRAIEPGRATVILEHAAVTDFLLFMAYEGFGALSVLEGRSFLSGKMGRKVFGDNITIADDAYEPTAPGLAFDFEGCPRRRVPLVTDGVARGMVHDRRTARRMKKRTTGHALPQPNPYGPLPLNLVMASGDSSLDRMIAGTKRGILVTHFHYTNVIDPMKMVLTGMTRDGTFLVEKGRVGRPVKNMRFTVSALDAFSNVEAISRDRRYSAAFFGGGFVVPALKIRDFNFSSATGF